MNNNTDKGLQGNEKIEEAIAGFKRKPRRRCWRMLLP